MSEPHNSAVAATDDVSDLHEFGYNQKLRRALGPYGSFAIAFSMISITTAIFYLFPGIFQTVGGVGIWLWIPCAAGLFLVVLVYAHLSARMPITGFAYQWTSRLTNTHYGWFTGWTGLLAFFAGTASIAAALATVFAPDIWASPTHADIVGFATAAIVVAALLNIISIKAVSWVNNVGTSMEIIGAVVAALLLIVGALFFFHHPAGGHILVQVGASGGGIPLWYGFTLASLLPVYTLLGWEGAADLAEETRDPRRVTPWAMIRANYVSTGAALFVVIGFAIAIPAGIAKMLGQPKNPLLYIFQSHFGTVGEDLLQVAVFAAIFSCLLANMVVATRLTYALARDKMLPGSLLFSSVPHRTRTPIGSIILVGLVAIGVNLLSQGLANNVVSIVDLAYYAMYLLVLVGVVAAVRSSSIPEVPSGYFSLGRWLKPILTGALVWVVAVILAGALPHSGHTGLEYLVGAEILGVLWYTAVLRRRIRSGEAGVGQERAAEGSGETQSTVSAPAIPDA